MRLGDLDALKEKLNEIFDTVEVVTFDDIIAIIDNAPTVEPEIYMNGKDFNLYLEGYKVGKKHFERPQGEWTELTDEVWKLYKKHQSHLATYVLEFGEELADLLGKYNDGGAEE